MLCLLIIHTADICFLLKLIFDIFLIIRLSCIEECACYFAKRFCLQKRQAVPLARHFFSKFQHGWVAGKWERPVNIFLFRLWTFISRMFSLWRDRKMWNPLSREVSCFEFFYCCVKLLCKVLMGVCLCPVAQIRSYPFVEVTIPVCELFQTAIKALSAWVITAKIVKYLVDELFFRLPGH